MGALIDERNFFESSHPGSPGERLTACRNVDLGRLRAALLEATEKELEKVRARIENRSLPGSATHWITFATHGPIGAGKR